MTYKQGFIKRIGKMLNELGVLSDDLRYIVKKEGYANMVDYISEGLKAIQDIIREEEL